MQPPGAWRFGGALPGGRRRRRREAVGLDAWLDDPCFLFIHPPPHDVGVHVRLHRSPLGGKNGLQATLRLIREALER